MSCGADGDLTLTARTDDTGLIHSSALGIGAGAPGAEAKHENFTSGEVFDTGFDDSHSGIVRYFDDDEAVAVDISTEEQGGTCVAFGNAAGGPHEVSASIAAR